MQQSSQNEQKQGKRSKVRSKKKIKATANKIVGNDHNVKQWNKQTLMQDSAKIQDKLHDSQQKKIKEAKNKKDTFIKREEIQSNEISFDEMNFDNFNSDSEDERQKVRFQMDQQNLCEENNQEDNSEIKYKLQELNQQKYSVLNREEDDQDDEIIQQCDIYLPDQRLQEENERNLKFFQDILKKEEEKQSHLNQLQEKQLNEQFQKTYFERKIIVNALEKRDAGALMKTLSKFSQEGEIQLALANTDETKFKDILDTFMQVFEVLMMNPQAEYIFYIEQIFKCRRINQLLNQQIERGLSILFYKKFIISSLNLLKITSNINVVPIDKIIDRFNIDKQNLQYHNEYKQVQQLVENILQVYVDQKQQQLIEEQLQKQRELRRVQVQEMQGIIIDYIHCPAEPTKLDFDFQKGCYPPFGQLFPLIQNGGYLTEELFINNHFYILREDYLMKFRKAVYTLCNNGIHNFTKDVQQDIFIYTDITYKQIIISPQGFQLKLKITPYYGNQSRCTVNWKLTNRLMSGSLVMFTDTYFNYKNIFLTVIDKEFKNERQKSVDVTFKVNSGLLSEITQIMTLINSQQRGFLIENKVYYEPYVHFLKCLKQIDPMKLPFKEQIVYQQKSNPKPIYIQKIQQKNLAVQYDIGLKFNLEQKNQNYKSIKINLFDEWPQDIQESLDNSQVKALQMMLRQGIGIVQGPPGTGKTFCGALAVRILIQNRNTINFQQYQNRPILIVCYTNHALDQFLKHILTFTDQENVIRIGGRCQDEDIKKILLQNQPKSKLFFPFKEFHKNREKLQKKLGYTLKQQNSLSLKFMNALFPTELQRILQGFLNMQQIVYHKYLSDLSNEYIIYLWSTISYKEIKQYHYEVVRDIESSKMNQIYKIRQELYDPQKVPQLYQTSKDNSNQSDLEENFRFDDNILLNSDEEEDRKIYNNIYFDYYGMENYIEIVNQKDNIIKFQQLENKYKHQNNKLIPYQPPPIWVDKINIQHKILNYRYKNLCNKYQDDIDRYQLQQRRLQDLYMEQDLRIIQQKQIVGLTVTGCAKYAKHLDKLKFGIMIIEEAAEVLESHTIAILSKNVEHLILIGDHQQLRPKLENYMIEKKYKTNISLFERLINNGINFVTLSNQRRMRTDFANIIRLIYGDEYQDHPQTYKQNQVQIKGLKHHLVFFDHKIKENQNSEQNSSKYNIYEQDMIFNLVRYLIANEYEQTQITVLSMYTKQVIDLKQKFKSTQLQKIKVQTVDNYQGEENDIVILSLVRSNDKNQMGFIGIDNRICVALSRARIGLYVFGDFEFIEKSVKYNNNQSNQLLWLKIIQYVKENNFLMDKIITSCQSHQKEKQIQSVKDWKQVIQGGCEIECQIRFTCGHVCKQSCHQLKHIKQYCPERCECVLDCGHQCQARCNIVPCPKCEVVVEKQLPCGHKQNEKCFDVIDKIFCKSPCERKLKCGHSCPLLCGNLCSNSSCMTQIQLDLICGHMKTINCCDRNNNSRNQCEEQIDFKFQCLHINRIDCNQKGNIQYLKCKRPCERKLICGHQCYLICGQICTNGSCMQQIQLDLKCGHTKTINCCDKNNFLKNQCEELIDYKFQCGHINKIECHQQGEAQFLKCKTKCNRLLECGHKCKQLCYQKCEQNSCNKLVKVDLDCGHYNPKFRCGDKMKWNTLCQTVISRLLECGHSKSVACGKRIQSIQCVEKCLKILQCGHQCKKCCYADCKNYKCEECQLYSNISYRNQYNYIKLDDQQSQSETNKCNKLLPCSHRCNQTSYHVCSKNTCEVIIRVELQCGHEQMTTCRMSNKISQIECNYNMQYVKKCGHTIQTRCCSKDKRSCYKCNRSYYHSENDICQDKNCQLYRDVKQACGHNIVVKCSDKDLIYRCQEQCQRKLNCGHNCKLWCFEFCSKSICQEEIQIVLKCGHTIPSKCSTYYTDQFKKCSDQCKVQKTDQKSFVQDNQ